jgi:hypothetical protein
MNKFVKKFNGLLVCSPPEIISMLATDKKKTINKKGIQALWV